MGLEGCSPVSGGLPTLCRPARICAVVNTTVCGDENGFGYRLGRLDAFVGIIAGETPKVSAPNSRAVPQRNFDATRFVGSLLTPPPSAALRLGARFPPVLQPVGSSNAYSRLFATRRV